VFRRLSGEKKNRERRKKLPGREKKKRNARKKRRRGRGNWKKKEKEKRKNEKGNFSPLILYHFNNDLIIYLSTFITNFVIKRVTS